MRSHVGRLLRTVLRSAARAGWAVIASGSTGCVVLSLPCTPTRGQWVSQGSSRTMRAGGRHTCGSLSTGRAVRSRWAFCRSKRADRASDGPHACRDVVSGTCTVHAQHAPTMHRCNRRTVLSGASGASHAVVARRGTRCARHRRGGRGGGTARKKLSAPVTKPNATEHQRTPHAPVQEPAPAALQ